MKKNFHYVITAVFIKNDVDVKRFEPHFAQLMDIFHSRTLDNPKKVEDISLSDSVPGRAALISGQRRSFLPVVSFKA